MTVSTRRNQALSAVAALALVSCHVVFPYSGASDGRRPDASRLDGPHRDGAKQHGEARVDLRKKDGAAATPTVTTVYGDGKCGMLCGPHGLHLANGTLYIASIWSYRICSIPPPVIGQAIQWRSGAGQPGYLEGALLAAQFKLPSAVTSLGPGQLLVADSGNHRIRLLDLGQDKTSTYAGKGVPGAADGLASAATFDEPGEMVVVGGTVYVVDTSNNRIREISGGIVSTYAGTGNAVSADGPLLGASFNWPHSIAYDEAAKVFYVTECLGHRVRKLSGGQVSTLAGNGNEGLVDGPVLQARFNCPAGVVAHGGKVMVADYFNDRIRLIEGGQVTTLAGSIEGHLDGPALTARFQGPDGLALDVARGILYVTEYDSPYVRAVTGLSL